MGETETTYVVKTKYTAEDHASRELHEIKDQAERTAEAVEKVKEGLRMAAEIIGLREMVAKAAETFVGFNAKIEQTKIRLSTMIGANWKSTWRQSTDAASEMYEQLEKFAEKAPVSAEEMAQFGQTVSASVIAAGGSLKELTKIAEEGSVASKALGQDAMTGAMTMQRMLSGMVSNRDVMGKMLLGTMNMSSKQWMALSSQMRLQKLEGALGSDTMKQANEAMTQSFSGAVYMFKDKMEVALGKVGLPLFKAMTSEVRSWSEWIEANPKKIEAITHSMTDGLKSAMSMLRDVGATLYPLIKEAFSIVGDVVHFVSEHSEMLTGVMKGLLLYKGVGMAGSLLGGAQGLFGGIGSQASGLAKAFGEVREALAGAGGATSIGGLFGSLGSAIGPLIGATGYLALFGTALYGLYEWMFGKTKAEKEQEAENQRVTLSAKQWLASRGDREALEQRKKAAGILDDKDTYGGINESLRKLGAGREDAITALMRGGFITEEFVGGHRRLSQGAGNEQGFTKEELQAGWSAAASIIRETYEQDMKSHDAYVAESGMSPMSYLKYGKTSGGGLYAEEDVVHSVEEAEKSPDLAGKAAVNQTININISQVSAKDPDRWLADLDDMAGRLGNRPRRAKSSLATKAGAGY